MDEDEDEDDDDHDDQRLVLCFITTHGMVSSRNGSEWIGLSWISHLRQSHGDWSWKRDVGCVDCDS